MPEATGKFHLARLYRLAAPTARADEPFASAQFCALSAAIDAPLRTAARHFAEPALIESKGRRVIDEELLPLESLASLRNLFARLSAWGWKKVFAFCRSRAEREELAHHFHGTMPFADRVFAHHANLAARAATRNTASPCSTRPSALPPPRWNWALTSAT